MKTFAASLTLALIAVLAVGADARTPSDKCYAIIKEFEGLRLTAYQ